MIKKEKKLVFVINLIKYKINNIIYLNIFLFRVIGMVMIRMLIPIF